MKHPSWQEWTELVRGELDAERERACEEHARDCDSCRADLELLRRLERAGSIGPLVDPPDAILEEAARRSAQTDIPEAPTDAESVDWELADVRGADAAAAGEAVYMARSLPGVSLSVKVLPPGADRRWEIEGRLWMEQSDHDEALRLILVHGDHVLVDERVQAGEHFRLREVAESGWQLELHLPDGRTLLVDDPFA